MKILLVTQYFKPERFVINELATDLVRRGHDVTVLTGMPNYPAGAFAEGYGGFRVKHETWKDVSIIRVPIIARGHSRAQLAFNYLSYALVASLAAPFVAPKIVDVVFVFQPSPVTVGIPAMIVRWFRRAPIVFWVQDLWPETLKATGEIANPAVLRLIGSLVRFIYRRCSLILVQSHAFIDHIRTAAPSADIRYLPNSANGAYLPGGPPANAPERDTVPDGFRVVMAGNMGAAQDLETVIAAAEHLRERKDIRWVLIGDGRKRQWVEQEIRRRDLAATVSILGPFPPESMPPYLALADVLLATLGKEPIFASTVPSRVVGYLAAGRPIIVAIDGEAARVVEQAGAGLTCPAGDPARLAATVARLVDGPASDREAMARAGRSYFEQQFAHEVVVDRLESMLASVVNNRHSAAQAPESHGRSRPDHDGGN